MRILKWILKSILLLVLVTIIFFIYTRLNGSPIEKYYFKKEVQKYLFDEYPEDEFIVHSIGYGFKEMNYYGDVSPKNNKSLHFWVEENNQGELYDTLQVSIQEYSVNQKCESVLKQLFDNSSCNADMYGSKIIVYIETENKDDNIDKYNIEIVTLIASISDDNLSLTIHINDKIYYIKHEYFKTITLEENLLYEK